MNIDPKLYEAVQGGKPAELGPFMELSSWLTRQFKTGTTGLSVGFNMVTNVIRDMPAAGVQGRRMPGESRVTAPVKRMALAATQRPWKRWTRRSWSWCRPALLPSSTAARQPSTPAGLARLATWPARESST